MKKIFDLKDFKYGQEGIMAEEEGEESTVNVRLKQNLLHGVHAKNDMP